jgi:hypothetical protein
MAVCIRVPFLTSAESARLPESGPKPFGQRGGQFRRRETDSDWLAISRANFNFTSYLSALNSFKRERATSFTDSTANGRIL